jgi:signal transduction histidine kinase
MSPAVLLERVVSRHAIGADQNQIELVMNVATDLPQVNVDVERLSQVLDNLIVNAFRYTPAGGQVILAAARVGESVQLTVSDTGIGISADDLLHVFDRFYRGEKSRPHNGESGLGLAIAKSIVEAHGGTISVESTLGKGARFIIHLNPYPPNQA